MIRHRLRVLQEPDSSRVPLPEIETMQQWLTAAPSVGPLQQYMSNLEDLRELIALMHGRRACPRAILDRPRLESQRLQQGKTPSPPLACPRSCAYGVALVGAPDQRELRLLLVVVVSGFVLGLALLVFLIATDV